MPLMKPAFEARSHLKNEPTKEQLLATKYKLDRSDGNLPLELRKWSHKKQNRISGGIPVNEDDGDDQSLDISEGEILWQRQETAVRNIFTDPRISVSEREVIAKALLEGNFSIDNNSYSREMSGDMHQDGGSGIEYITHADGTRHLLKKVYEKDLIRGEANVHRARMRKPNFLEAEGVQAPIILVDPRMVQFYEQQKTKMHLQSPSKGKKGVYTWAGQTLIEKAIPDTIGNSKQYFEQIKNEQFTREKKKMLISAKHRELLRAKAMIATTKKLGHRTKQAEKDRKANIGLRREYINNFRNKLKEHLLKTENPMMGTIMKYMNDQAAWSILQAYKGYTMSMAAVVGLIGQTLGTLEPVETNDSREGHIEVEDALAAQWHEIMEHKREFGGYADGNTGNNTPHTMGHTYLTEVYPSAPNTANSDILVGLHDDTGMGMEGDVTGVVGGDSIRFRDGSESVHNSMPGSDMHNDSESHQQTLNDSIATSQRELEVLPQTTVTIGEVKKFHEKNAFIKPLSAKGLPVKSRARENVFAPRGIQKADLPYTTNRANYKLGSRGRSRGDSKGNTGGEGKVRWNSDDVNPLHPSDRLVIDETSGTIINVNAWHSNPGSRANTPSTLGIKGWNANVPMLKKFAAGYTSEMDESGALVRPGTGKRSRPQTSDNYQENSDSDGHVYRQHAPVQGERMVSPNRLQSSQEMEMMEGSQFAQSQADTKYLHASISQLSMPHESMTHMTQSVNLGSNNASINDSALDPEEWDFVKPLVSAIEHEKIALGTIARHQPEIVLTDAQLDELGKGLTTIDTIAAHARWAREKKLRMSQKMQITEAQMVNQAFARSSGSGVMDRGREPPHSIGIHDGGGGEGSPKMTTTATATNTGTEEGKGEGQVTSEGRVQTSQTLANLNAMTSMNDPPGGVEIKINQFSNMDVEMGFRPEPTPGSHEDIGIKPLTPLDVKSPLLSTQTNATLGGGTANMSPTAVGITAQSPQLSPTLQAIKSQSNMSIGTGPMKDTGSLDKSMYSLDNSKEITRLINSNIKAPPHQLKSLAKPLPESPFKTYEERTRVIQSGVAANAGLSLWLSKTEREARLQRWGPRAKSREGRYRVGKSSDPSAGFSPTKDQVAQKKKKSNLLP